MTLCSIQNISEISMSIITLLLLFVAFLQLHYLNKTRKADFIHRFKRDFFNEDTRQILFTIDQDLLTFVEPPADSKNPYFEINKENMDKMPDAYIEYQKAFKKTNYTIEALKIDYYLLGHFEDIGLFEKKGIMDIGYVYESFDWYIQLVHKDCAIQKYIRWVRKQENSQDVYKSFDDIADKCKRYGMGEIRNWKIFD